MGKEIEVGGVNRREQASAEAERLFVPMKIGNATVFIEQAGFAKVLEAGSGSGIYLAAPDPEQIFDQAVEVIRECVRKVGERVEALAEKAVPKEITIEFSITFDAKAKGAIIPIFVTAEHGLQTGLKVTATWEPKATKAK